MAALVIAALLVSGVDGSPFAAPLEVVPAPATRVAVTVQVADPPPLIPANPWDRVPPGTHCLELLPYAMQAGIEPEDFMWYGNVAWGESHCQPDVRNACCFGALQIHYAIHKGRCGLSSGYDLYDPTTTFRCARTIEQASGRHPWAPHHPITGCFPRGFGTPC